MFKPKPDKFTATVTSEKNRQHKPVIQIEGKLTKRTTRGDRCSWN